MIPFTDSYQRGLANYLQSAPGQQPTGLSDTPGAGFESAIAENPFVQSRLITKDLATQADKAADLGETLPSPVMTQNWLDNRTGGDAIAQQAKDSLASYDAQILDINRRKGTDFKTSDEIFQARADAAKQQAAEAGQVLSRASAPAQVFGQLTGGMAGTLVDPMQAATLLTPMSVESFGGNLAVRLAKVAGTQAIAQGFTTLVEQERLRDFYKAQGLSDDDVDAKIWQSAGGAALGGAIFAPAFELGGLGIRSIWRSLRGGTLAERGEAVDALGKVDLGVDGNSDVRNLHESLDVEGQNPLTPSTMNNRLHTNALDEKTAALNAGDNPLTADNSRVTNSIPLDQHGDTNVVLESELSRSAAQDARDLATQHEQRAIAADIEVQKAKDEQTFLTGELKNKNVSVDALEQAGALDAFSARAVRDIDDKLSLPVILGQGEKAALEKQRTAFLQSGARNYRQVIQQRIDGLKATAKDARADGKQARLDAKEATAQAESHLNDAAQAERPTAEAREPTPITPPNKQPLSASEVAAHVDAAKQVRDLDDPIIKQARASLEESDHVVDGISMKAHLDELDAREKEINDYISCIGGA